MEGGLTIGQPTALGITVARWEERLAVFLGIFALLIVLTKGYGTPERPGSWNDQARFATIQSLVEQQTWAIDNTSLGYWTGDKVFVGEHFYSTKPPLLSALGAVLYWPMHHLLGWSYFNELQAPTIYYLITLLLMGLPLAGASVLLYNTLQEFGLSPRWRILGVVSFAIGSLYLPYTTIFQNHTIAGIAGLYSFILVLRTTRNIGPAWRNLMLAGLMAGFALACDIVGAAPFVVALLSWTGVRCWQSRQLQETGWLLLGFLAPVGIHFVCNWVMIGDWRPIYTKAENYVLTAVRGYYGEVLERRGYIATLFDQYRWRYIFNSLFGIRGIFFYTPTLLFGFWIGWKLLQKNWQQILDVTAAQEAALRAWTAGFLGMTCVSFLYLLLRTENYGGTSYGSRYFIAPMAVLLLFAALTYGPLGTAKARGWYAEALRWGVLCSVVGVAYPWGIALIGGAMTNFSLAANLQGYSYYLMSLLLTQAGYLR
ncbi:MAG: hypothetical protein GEEBNDBF_02251 [bacterium]|nr:hypothetical protein [bacterium]